MDAVPIQQQGDAFAVLCVAINTPQGKRLIANPQGSQAQRFETLEEACQAVWLAGFDAMFQNQRLLRPEHRAASTVPMPVRRQPGQAQTLLEWALGALQASQKTLLARQHDKESGVLAQLAYLLGQWGQNDATQQAFLAPVLLNLLAHDDATVRKQVAMAWADWVLVQPEPTLKLLFETFANNTAQTVRLSVVQVMLELFQLEQPHILPTVLPIALPWLIQEASQDSHWLVRAHACQAIGRAMALLRQAEADSVTER